MYRLPLRGMLLIVALLTTSCIFGSPPTVNVTDIGNGELSVSISTLATWTTCSNDEDVLSYFCVFFSDVEPQPSTVTLTELGLAFLLLIDPLVLQLPDTVHDIGGSYALIEGSEGGQLDITVGLTTVRADADRTITAEPGMQLVVFDLPEGAPNVGDVALNIRFQMPAGETELPMKAVFTGRIESNGETYYPPLMPCATDMSSMPTLSIPLPAGGEIVMPPREQTPGCQNEVYRFGAAQTDDFTIFLPTVQN